MVGIVPGPGLLTEHLELSLTMFLTIIVANLVGAAIVFVTVRYLVKLTTVHQRYLFCIILSIIFVGVFVNGEHILSIPIVIVFGILGFLMKRFNYPRPSLALGFVLGALFEHYLNLSLMTVGPLFFLRPISLIIIAITILVLAYGPIRSILGRRKKRVITL
jgi:TctA family transporter